MDVIHTLKELKNSRKTGVPFLVQFWRFASPVAYPSSLVPPRWRWLCGLNPYDRRHRGFRWRYWAGKAARLVLLASADMVLVMLFWRIDLVQQSGVDHSGHGLAYA